jgi:hypothetical protein
MPFSTPTLPLTVSAPSCHGPTFRAHARFNRYVAESEAATTAVVTRELRSFMQLASKPDCYTRFVDDLEATPPPTPPPADVHGIVQGGSSEVVEATARAAEFIGKPIVAYGTLNDALLDAVWTARRSLPPTNQPTAMPRCTCHVLRFSHCQLHPRTRFFSFLSIISAGSVSRTQPNQPDVSVRGCGSR